jgi:hypothetical protein
MYLVNSCQFGIFADTLFIFVYLCLSLFIFVYLGFITARVSESQVELRRGCALTIGWSPATDSSLTHLGILARQQANVLNQIPSCLPYGRIYLFI